MSCYPITGCVKPGDQFRFEKPPHQAAQATFITFHDEKYIVTRYVNNLFKFDDKVTVIANWHGQYRTDAFATTVGELKEKAKFYNDNCKIVK